MNLYNDAEIVICINMSIISISCMIFCFRKMTKHICILIPLFGVPYMIFTIMSVMLDVAYLYAEMFFSSFQVNWHSTSLVFNIINIYTNTWFFCAENREKTTCFYRYFNLLSHFVPVIFKNRNLFFSISVYQFIIGKNLSPKNLEFNQN